MAHIGPNLVGHTLDLVLKGERGAPVTGVVVHAGDHGIVIATDTPGEPWHTAAGDVSRWRLACGCTHLDLGLTHDAAGMPAPDWGCPALTNPHRRLAETYGEDVIWPERTAA